MKLEKCHILLHRVGGWSKNTNLALYMWMAADVTWIGSLDVGRLQQLIYGPSLSVVRSGLPSNNLTTSSLAPHTKN